MERLVAQAPGNAETFRWAVIRDMLGYYVLLAPLFVAVGRRLYDLGEQGAGWWTIGALIYVTAGSVAAMALAYGVPPILEGYGQASGSGRQGLVLALTALVEAAVRGGWQTLDPIVVGAWAVASGLALRRLGRRALGAVGVVLGTSAALFVSCGPPASTRRWCCIGRGRVRCSDLGLRAWPGSLAVEAVEVWP
ncbi:MAG TPA: hypothetical protein VFN05_13865 [Actinomycetes bacterium]|nr:hypothetical protein [Actinomycetes bacterium]